MAGEHGAKKWPGKGWTINERWIRGRKADRPLAREHSAVNHLAHFGLAIPPFASTPDPSFFFPSHDYSNIVASLEFAIRRDFGIVKLVGGDGTGKTTLSRLLQGNLVVDHGAVAMLDARAAGRILSALCASFDVHPGSDPFEALRRHLLSQHHFGRLTVAIIDEAHRLDADDFENLLKLERLEIEKKKLLQIVLMGDPLLDERLKEPEAGDLARHIVFSLSTNPLAEAEACRYVLHRLRLARPLRTAETEDEAEVQIFSEPALEQLARWSGGVPQVLNLLAEWAMQRAFEENARLVQPSHVLAAARAYPGLVVGRPSRLSLLRPGRRRVRFLTILLILALGVMGVTLWARQNGFWESSQTVSQPMVLPTVPPSVPASPVQMAPPAPVAPAPVAPAPVTPAPVVPVPAVPEPAMAPKPVPQPVAPRKPVEPPAAESAKPVTPEPPAKPVAKAPEISKPAEPAKPVAAPKSEEPPKALVPPSPPVTVSKPVQAEPAKTEITAPPPASSDVPVTKPVTKPEAKPARKAAPKPDGQEPSSTKSVKETPSKEGAVPAAPQEKAAPEKVLPQKVLPEEVLPEKTLKASPPAQISPDDAAPPPPGVPAPVQAPAGKSSSEDIDLNDALKAGSGVYPGHKR